MEKEIIELKIQVAKADIAGCLDICDIFGGDYQGKEVEEIISEVFANLLTGLRNDKVLADYKTVHEVNVRLSKYFDTPLGEESPDADDDATTFKEIENKVQSKTPFTSPEKLEELDKELKELEASEKEIEPDDSEPSLSFSDFPKDDELVLRCGSNEHNQAVLCKLYETIPSRLWGTDKALEMLNLMLAGQSEE